MTSTTTFASPTGPPAPTLSATGRETIVLTVGPASADQFVSLVETFGEATRSACRSLVLDLSAVDRIDSDLLGLLLWAHGRLSQRGAHLVVARPSAATRALLGKSGLDHVLQVSDSLPAVA
ncbi:MAG: STAS domain-containing protein [Actinomycetia bacterium]|nr:STAS domain-containing protein [Actinomycetes bacterium]